MPSSVGFIIVAWVCYTVAIWSDKRQKQLKTWMLLVFISGFCIDFTGTSIMAHQHQGLSATLHGRLGQGALLFMFVHLLAAIIVLYKKGSYQKLFSRFSAYAWTLWTLALFTGPFVH